MDVHRVLDHVVGGDALALVFRMGLAGVGQVERGVELLGGHRRVGGIDDSVSSADALDQAMGVHHVRLFLDVPEVLGLSALVLQTFLVGVEHDVVGTDAAGDVFLPRQVDSLGNGLYGGSKLFTIHFSLFT